MADSRFPAPAFLSLPSSTSSLGATAVELSARAGLVLDPWQEFALTQILNESSRGIPAAFESCIIVPRQNGKGSILEALSLAWLFLTDTPLILHSAHEFKTASEAFRRLRALILNAPFLARRVAKITTANGDEKVELTTGQRIRYVARSKGSGRGFSGGKLILDEAYAIEAEEMAALLPTLATYRSAQIIYTSSAGMPESTHLRRLRDRGRKGDDPSLCYMEWCSTRTCPDDCDHDPDRQTCMMNDPAQWHEANPGLGIRIPQTFVHNERLALPAEVFARERLGWWDDRAGKPEAPISLDEWARCADGASQVVGPVIFAVDATPGSRRASLAAVGRRQDGLPHVELVDARTGTDWVVQRLRELMERHETIPVQIGDSAHDGVVLDPAGPVGGLIQPLRAAGINPALMTTRDMGQACGAFQSAIRAGAIRHIDQPPLSAAIAGAIARPIGDGIWAWGRMRSERASIDISPLVAVTAGLWGLSLADAAPAPQEFFASWR